MTMIKELKRGDRLELADGGAATITNVARDHLIEVSGDVSYLVSYKDDDGETGQMIVGGKSKVSLLKSGD